MMRVLVLWADDRSPNLGVRALGAGTAALVHRVWPQAEVTFHSFGTPIPQVPLGRLRSLVRERITGRHGMQAWFRGFDLVIDMRAGDSLADLYGLRRLATMTTVGEFASQAGVRVVLGPQTIGPFSTLRGKMLGRRSLRRAATVLARDSASARYAEGLGRRPVAVSTDVVFALPVPSVGPARDVVLNLSGLLWNANPHVDWAHYRRVAGELTERLHAQGRTVSVLAHVLDSRGRDNDVPALREFCADRDDVELIIPSGLDEVRSVVSGAKLVIGSRMHVCLNALSVGTPAIALAYSRKFAPLFSDLGWRASVDARQPDAADEVVSWSESAGLAASALLAGDRAHELVGVAERALGRLA